MDKKKWIMHDEWTRRVTEVVDKVLLYIEETEGSVVMAKDPTALADTKAALTNFLKEIYNLVPDASQYSNPRTRIDTRFRRLVRDYISVSGEASSSKSPAFYNHMIGSFGSYDDPDENERSPLMKALIELRILLENNRPITNSNN
jgi:hypothetical protein